MADKKRIDPARMHLNKVLANPLNVNTRSAKSVLKSFQAHWKDKEIAIKKDSVLLIDMVITTSPEFWGDNWHQNGAITPETRKKLEEWVAVQMDFVGRQLGPDAIKFAVLHLDEKTPHIHLMLSPEETKTLKYKNQYGTQERTVNSLNANRWNPNFWKKFVTAHAKANAHLGLKRPIKGSTAEKISNREFTERVKQAETDDYKKIIDELVADFVKDLGLLNTKTQVKELFLSRVYPRLQILVKNNFALKKLVQTNREKEYAVLDRLKERAEKEIAKALAQQTHYGKGLKTIADLRNENRNLRAENNMQKSVITSQAKKIIELERARTVENAGAGQAGRKIKLDK
ncbi:plasmid recombination protein [Acidovorax sp. SUPP1855]|nr:plasmid recombination protein [Acidovorax sp. SUPP1855]